MPYARLGSTLDQQHVGLTQHHAMCLAPTTTALSRHSSSDAWPRRTYESAAFRLGDSSCLFGVKVISCWLLQYSVHMYAAECSSRFFFFFRHAKIIPCHLLLQVIDITTLKPLTGAFAHHWVILDTSRIRLNKPDVDLIKDKRCVVGTPHPHTPFYPRTP